VVGGAAIRPRDEQLSVTGRGDAVRALPDERQAHDLVAMGRAHELLTKVEEALLSRTLVGRRLAADVRDAQGHVAFAAGAEIDHALLEAARGRDLLEEVARAAEPGTSDTELEDLFIWLRDRRG
jgi:hypothetical protein